MRAAETAATSSARLPALDGWRALAIILVLVSHVRYAGEAPTSFELLNPLGDLGVRIFFVLSGFLITLLLLGEATAHGHIALRAFYLRRALRILPIYCAYLSVLAMLAAAGRYADVSSSWLGALTFTRNMVGRGNSATVHFWSLAIEEQFYLLWPVALASLRLWQRPRLFVASLMSVAVASAIFRSCFVSTELGGSVINRLFVARSAFAYADALAIGCLAAWFARQQATLPPSRVQRGSLVVAAIAAIAASEAAIFHPACEAYARFAPTIEAVSFAFLIWVSAFVRTSWLSRLLDLRPVALFGTWSYSLYVWHVLVLEHFMPRFSGNPAYHWTVWWLSATVLAIGSYYGLERPVLRLKALFARNGLTSREHALQNAMFERLGPNP